VAAYEIMAEIDSGLYAFNFLGSITSFLVI